MPSWANRLAVGVTGYFFIGEILAEALVSQDFLTARSPDNGTRVRRTHLEIVLCILGIVFLIGVVAAICEAFEKRPVRKTVVIHYR